MIDVSTHGRPCRPGRIARRALPLVALWLAAFLGAWPAQAAPRGGCAESVPFVAGSEGYHAFRIPAVVAAGPVVVAFAEGRRESLADYGDIDIVARRSFDGGCSWGPLRVVAQAGADTIGNPAPVVDRATGRITLLACGNPGDASLPRRVFALQSDDAGATWSAPREITEAVTPPGQAWDWYATGPGHGLQLRQGRHAGRLLIPANHTDAPRGETRYGAHSLISDDGGRSWRVGYVARPAGEELRLNENTFAELPDGRIYSTVRDQHGSSAANRADALLAPGGAALLASYAPQPGLAGPVVQGSTLLVGRPGGERPVLVYSGPADPDGRAAMTLRVSEDEGVTWRPGPRLSRRPAAYSDLVRLDAATVGLLYETGEDTPYETITFARVPVAALGGAPGRG